MQNNSNTVLCLVDVFIALDKAILSYYDLAYRFNFELRVPVMAKATVRLKLLA